MREIITETLITVALALITLGASYATYYIKKATEKVQLETKKIEKEQQQVLFETALNRLEDVAYKTVSKIEEKTAKNLRKSVKDGKVDRKELESLAEEAYREIILVLEPDYSELIKNTLGDARTYILNLIEEKVIELKDP